MVDPFVFTPHLPTPAHARAHEKAKQNEMAPPSSSSSSPLRQYAPLISFAVLLILVTLAAFNKAVISMAIHNNPQPGGSPIPKEKQESVGLAFCKTFFYMSYLAVLLNCVYYALVYRKQSKEGARREAQQKGSPIDFENQGQHPQQKPGFA